VGSSADLVAFDRDPREDVTALRYPVAVLRAGRLLVDPR
jgi:imidazolonepropionase-like amidohydrolase